MQPLIRGRDFTFSDRHREIRWKLRRDKLLVALVFFPLGGIALCVGAAQTQSPVLASLLQALGLTALLLGIVAVWSLVTRPPILTLHLSQRLDEEMDGTSEAGGPAIVLYQLRQSFRLGPDGLGEAVAVPLEPLTMLCQAAQVPPAWLILIQDGQTRVDRSLPEDYVQDLRLLYSPLAAPNPPTSPTLKTPDQPNDWPHKL